MSNALSFLCIFFSAFFSIFYNLDVSYVSLIHLVQKLVLTMNEISIKVKQVWTVTKYLLANWKRILTVMVTGSFNWNSSCQCFVSVNISSCLLWRHYDIVCLYTVLIFLLMVSSVWRISTDLIFRSKIIKLKISTFLFA